MLDIAHQLAAQVGDGGEDPPRGDIALDLGEPEFDLIEPGRVGRRVVKMDGRMRHQEGPDLLCFVGREIVHDDVDLAPSGLRLDDRLQEADEFRRIVDKMQKAAKEKRLDGATLAYVDMTMSCVECHKYARNVLVAQ